MIRFLNDPGVIATLIFGGTTLAVAGSVALVVELARLVGRVAKATDRDVADFLARVLPHRSIWKREDKTGGAGSIPDENAPRVLYLRRFFLTPHWFPVRVWIHFIAKSDDDRDLHTHPWDFATLILRNGYLEEQSSRWDGKREIRRPGSLAFRKAEDAHRVRLFTTDKGAFAERPAWTLMFARRARRTWGFLVTERVYNGADVSDRFYTRHVDWREYLGLPANTPDAPEDRR